MVLSFNSIKISVAPIFFIFFRFTFFYAMIKRDDPFLLRGSHESKIARILIEILRDYANFVIISTSLGLHKLLGYLFNTQQFSSHMTAL